jgi:hypothetical protein
LLKRAKGKKIISAKDQTKQLPPAVVREEIDNTKNDWGMIEKSPEDVDFSKVLIE